MQEQQSIKVFVLCRDANGAPDLVTYQIAATADEIGNGAHYEMAIARAENDAYESPFEAFDEHDPAARRIVRVEPEEPEVSHYLLIMVGDVEPELSGPYPHAEAVLEAARRQRDGDPDMENGLFRLTVRNGQPEVAAFSGMDLELDEFAP